MGNTQHIGVAHRLEEVCLPCPGNVYHFQGMPADQLLRTDFRTLPSRYAFYYKLNQNDFEQVLREHLNAQHSLVPAWPPRRPSSVRCTPPRWPGYRKPTRPSSTACCSKCSDCRTG
jgi:hypothetical protein